MFLTQHTHIGALGSSVASVPNLAKQALPRREGIHLHAAARRKGLAVETALFFKGTVLEEGRCMKRNYFPAGSQT